MRAAEGLYDETFSWYARRLLDLLPPIVERPFLGLTLWQFIGLAILAGLAWMLQALLGIFFRGFLVRFAARQAGWVSKELESAALPASWLASVWIFHRFLADLRFPVLVNQVLNVLLDLTLAGITVWFAFRAIDAVCTKLEAITAKTATTVDDHLVPLARTALRVGALIAAILLIAQSQDSRSPLSSPDWDSAVSRSPSPPRTRWPMCSARSPSSAIVLSRLVTGCWWTATKEPWSGSGCARPGSAPSTTRWSASRTARS